MQPRNISRREEKLVYKMFYGNKLSWKLRLCLLAVLAVCFKLCVLKYGARFKILLGAKLQCRLNQVDKGLAGSFSSGPWFCESILIPYLKGKGGELSSVW